MLGRSTVAIGQCNSLSLSDRYWRKVMQEPMFRQRGFKGPPPLKTGQMLDLLLRYSNVGLRGGTITFFFCLLYCNAQG